MAGVWTEVLPLALALAAAAALVRTRQLRDQRPGWAPLQRVGITLTTLPLFLLALVGLRSLPRLVDGLDPVAVPSEVLAGKALLHFLLYLAIPVVGIVLLLGPRRTWAMLPTALFGPGEPVHRAARGLGAAAVVSATLCTGVYVGWSAISTDAGLLSAEGPRVFFSQTTPMIALALAGVAAVAEELLFRGVLLSHLKRLTPVHAAVALQAALFGLIHAGYGSFLHVSAAAGFGLLMGYLVHRHGLLPAMVVHFLVNVVVLSAWSQNSTLLWAGIVLLGAVSLLAVLLRRMEPAPGGEAAPA